MKVHKVEADWLEDGGPKDDWSRPVISAVSLITWESGSNEKHCLASKHSGSTQMCDYTSSLLNLHIRFISKM